MEGGEVVRWSLKGDPRSQCEELKNMFEVSGFVSLSFIVATSIRDD